MTRGVEAGARFTIANYSNRRAGRPNGVNTALTMTHTERRRRALYGHPASQRQRDEREPKAETARGKLRRRHAEERTELGERHRREMSDFNIRAQHMEDRRREREVTELHTRHRREAGDLKAKHDQETERMYEAEEEGRR
jgi:hypothetical protein